MVVELQQGRGLSPASATYGAWVERRATDFCEQLNRDLEDQSAADRLKIGKDVQHAADVLNKNAARAEQQAVAEKTLDAHLSCSAAAKAGRLCCKNSMTDATDGRVIGAPLFVWVPGKVNNYYADAVAGVGAAHAANNANGGQAPVPDRPAFVVREDAFREVVLAPMRAAMRNRPEELPMLERPQPNAALRNVVHPPQENVNNATTASATRPHYGARIEIWHRHAEGDGRRFRFVSAFPKYGSNKMSVVFGPLGDSLVQDQMRAWMAAVRRSTARGESLAGSSSCSSPAALFPLPNLPDEVFHQIKSFLRPVESVLLNPTHLAYLAGQRRLQDLERVLDHALAACLQDMQQQAASVHPGLTKINGKLFLSTDRLKVWESGNLSLGVKLGNTICSVEGPRVWPCKEEEEVTGSAAWEAQRLQDIAAKCSMVPPSKAEARFDNIMSALRTFFEGKGLTFSPSDQCRASFAIAWPRKQSAEDGEAALR
ncbi:unnamed protein product [Amoebophrya sp. A120]|nr:unnamed protein product [Amoebophrya sp. A120]|eukprot:GSA120T00010886001.1